MCCLLRLQVDPFDPNSPIKQAAVEKFPPDMFFVLRVVQLLRGMANGKHLLVHGPPPCVGQEIILAFEHYCCTAAVIKLAQWLLANW